VLSNLNINYTATSRSVSKLILKLIFTLLYEYRSLRDEWNLNTLDTFPVEVWFQNERCKLLIYENLKYIDFLDARLVNLIRKIINGLVSVVTSEDFANDLMAA